jgi:hypothetical protein
LIPRTKIQRATWGRDADHPAARDRGYLILWSVPQVVSFEEDVFMKINLPHVDGKLGCHLPVVCVCQ